MKKHELLTAGYAGLKQDSFLWKLQRYEVDIVVDVREKPLSRNTDFTRSNLAPFLEDNNVEYLHIQPLGVPSHLRQELREGGDLDEYFDAYRTYLKKQADAIQELYKLATKKRCCLLCLEHKPEECHRSVLAQVIARQNGRTVEIVHI